MKLTNKKIMTIAVAMLSLVALCFSMVACTPSTTNEQSGEDNKSENETILEKGINGIINEKYSTTVFGERFGERFSAKLRLRLCFHFPFV